MAMILDAFVGTFVEKLTRMASEKVVMVLGVKDELKKLQQRMTRIQKFLEAAERRQLEDQAIKHWVGELRDAAYDANDIIDRCIIEGTALSLADRPSSSKKIAVCFDFSLLSACFASVPHRYEIAKSIKLLNDKLEEIYKDMLPFNFEARREQPELQKITTVNIGQTSPLVDVDVMGTEIEEATKKVVTFIVAEQAEKCRVIALTGMGGIGKTTLAQKIYNNEKIQTEFQNKVWVCISQNYDEIELLRQVIVNGAEGNHDDTRNEREHLPKNEREHLPKNKSELLPLLQSAYHGKSLFLVLDDVWRADVWIKLFRSPLQSAVAFLRILVTTRDENIAREMKAAYIHQVEQISDQIGWDILCKKIFLDGEETEIGKLKDIGLQIVKKCSGLPLAINAIAGVLAKKEKSRREWEKVLKNDAWSMKNLPEELKVGLYLSYDDLLSNLKQCFLYFSLFPEDALIVGDDLIRLWVAEGFVEEQNDSLMEDVAKDNYTELLRRNLLQVSFFMFPSNTPEYKIHDLMRSLAKFLSQDEIFSGTSTTPSSSMKLRRLSIETPKSLLAIKDLVVEQKCLRTLLAFNGINVLNDVQLVGLERLRVLRLENVDINNIPDSIGDLIHLRYLNLGGTKIRELPESIGNLINLQFLNLSDCIFLTTLPNSISRLHNLRCLDLISTSVISIPKGISKLEKINCFNKFVVADPREPEDSYTSLEELLSSLYRLRLLRIYRMERARSGALGLQKLTRLIQLELVYEELEEDITRIEDALEELCPPQCLEVLEISNFFGTHYPSWMKSPSFGYRLPCLRSLQVSMSCPQLPPVGELPELTKLYIYEANSVKSIGSEFLGTGVCDIHTTTRTAFPNLELLILDNMPELEEWSFNNETEGFERGRGMTHVLPHLKQLFIYYCPKLKALPKGLEQCKIKKLVINNAGSLKGIENLPTVEEMEIKKNQNLERVSNLTALYKLHVKKCPSLNCVEKLDSLQQLELIDYNLKEIPKYLERLFEERKPANVNDVFCLKITSDDATILRFLKGGPDWPIIVQIPQFIAYNRKGILVMRYTKNPSTYTTYEVPE